MPEDVDEIVFKQPLPLWDPVGMDHHHQPGPLDGLPQRVQPGRGNLLAFDVGADLDPAKTQVVGQVAQLRQRGVGVL